MKKLFFCVYAKRWQLSTFPGQFLRSRLSMICCMLGWWVIPLCPRPISENKNFLHKLQWFSEVPLFFSSSFSFPSSFVPFLFLFFCCPYLRFMQGMWGFLPIKRKTHPINRQILTNSMCINIRNGKQGVIVQTLMVEPLICTGSIPSLHIWYPPRDATQRIY